MLFSSAKVRLFSELTKQNRHFSLKLRVFLLFCAFLSRFVRLKGQKKRGERRKKSGGAVGLRRLVYQGGVVFNESFVLDLWFPGQM